MKPRRLACAALAVLALTIQPAWAGQLRDGIAAVERRDYGRARPVLESYLERFPRDPRPYYFLAECYKADYLVPKMEEMLQQYRRLLASRDEVLLTLSGAETPDVYKTMLADDPQDFTARLLLVASLLESRATMMAWAELQVLGRVSLPEALQDKLAAMWGTLYLQQGDYGKARQAFKEAWRLNPSHPLPPTRLAQLDQLEKGVETATSPAPQAAADPSKGFNLLYQLGQDLLREGNFEGAIDALNQALTLDPDRSEARELLIQARIGQAEALYQEGLKKLSAQDYAGAQSDFAAALSVDPAHPKAAEMARQARAQQEAAKKPAPSPAPLKPH